MSDPDIAFREVPAYRGRVHSIPSALPQLPEHEATRRVTLPLHVAWSGQRRDLDLGVRADRILAYRAVMQDGLPADILAIVDGALLIDAWPDLLLPPALAAHWAPLIDAARACGTGS